jgi:hypothetical protein
MDSSIPAKRRAFGPRSGRDMKMSRRDSGCPGGTRQCDVAVSTTGAKEGCMPMRSASSNHRRSCSSGGSAPLIASAARVAKMCEIVAVLSI